MKTRVVTKPETLLPDNARVVIYDRHMLIVQATGYIRNTLFSLQVFNGQNK